MCCRSGSGSPRRPQRCKCGCRCWSETATSLYARARTQVVWADRDGFRVERAARVGIAAVQGVVNLRVRRVAGDHQIECRRVEPAVVVEAGIGDEIRRATSVDRARGGRVEVAVTACSIATVGDVFALGWETEFTRAVFERSDGIHNGRAIGGDQGERLAICTEGEVRMQLAEDHRFGGLVGIHEQVGASGDARCWEGPLAEIRRIVAQVPTGQIDRQRAVVVQLDPVRAVVAGGVGMRATVARHQFIQDDIGLCRSEADEGQQETEKAEPAAPLFMVGVFHGKFRGFLGFGTTQYRPSMPSSRTYSESGSCLICVCDGGRI